MEVPVPVAVLALRGVVRAAAPGSCHSYSRVSRVLLLLLLLRSPEAGGRRQRLNDLPQGVRVYPLRPASGRPKWFNYLYKNPQGVHPEPGRFAANYPQTPPLLL